MRWFYKESKKVQVPVNNDDESRSKDEMEDVYIPGKWYAREGNMSYIVVYDEFKKLFNLTVRNTELGGETKYYAENEIGALDLIEALQLRTMTKNLLERS